MRRTPAICGTSCVKAAWHEGARAMKAKAPVHRAAHIPPVNISTPLSPHVDGSASDGTPAQHASVPVDTCGTPVASGAGADDAINASAVTATSALARIRSMSFTTPIYALCAAQVKATVSIRAPAPPVLPTSFVFRVGPNRWWGVVCWPARSWNDEEGSRGLCGRHLMP